MKASSILITLFLIFSLSSLANSQTDSCSSNLTLDGQLQFATNSLNCDSVWTAQDYVLRYAQASPNVWSFVLSAPDTNSYIAMGFSPTGDMIGSSAVVGWVTASGVAGIKQYFLGAKAADGVEPDQGSLVIVGNSSSILSVNSRIYIGFQLSTTQPGSKIIYSVGPTGIFPSSPGYRLTQHSDMTSTTMNYVTGQIQTVNSRPYSNLRKTHGILNMLGWGILLLIGAIVVRYFKEWDPIWFYSHVSIQSLGFILGVAGVACGFILENKLNVSVSHHKGIGIFILILGCLQVMAFLARPEKGTKYRNYWNWYHSIVGRLLMFFAAVNIFYGIHLGKGGSGWNVGYGVVLALLFVIVVVLEIRLWMRK